MKRLRILLPMACAAGLFVACGDDSSPAGSAGGGQSSVSGRVDETSQAPGSGKRTQAAEARTVAVCQVQSQGDLEVLAQADVRDDGRFTVEGVPSNRSDLVVVARSQTGTEVGRVLVHGRLQAGADARVEPIDAATTVRGRVYSELRASGHSEAARNSGEMTLFLRMDDTPTEVAGASQAQIRALADAYAESQATMTEVFAKARVDLDAEARAELFADLAADYAASVDAETRGDVAFEAFADACLDAMEDSGAELEVLAVATAGHVTAGSETSAGANLSTDARLGLVRSAVDMNLRVRERLATSVESSSAVAAQARATAAALAQARTATGNATTVAQIEASMSATATSSQEAFLTGMSALLPGLETTAQVEAALSEAFLAAELTAELNGASSSDAIARASVDYRSAVAASAKAIVDAMVEANANVNADAETIGKVLIAAGARGRLRL